MGYESKVIVAVRKESRIGKKHFVLANEIARFDLSKMGYEMVNGRRFSEIFTTPIDFNVYVKESDVEAPEDLYRKDCYGEHCKYTSPEDVIEWLEESETAKSYRRASLFLDALKAIQAHKSEFGQLVCVHYGY